MGECEMAAIRAHVQQRLRLAQVMVALAQHCCPACGANSPRVTSTQGVTRYVKCRFCGANGKVVVL